MNLREHDRPGMAVRWILWLLTMAGWCALIYGAALVIGHDADREWEIRQRWIDRETGRTAD